MFLFQTQALPAFDAHTFVFTACVAFGLKHSRLRDLPFWKRNSESVTEYGAFPGRTLGALAAGQLLSSERCSASKICHRMNPYNKLVHQRPVLVPTHACCENAQLCRRNIPFPALRSPQSTLCGLENGRKHAISVVNL